MLNQPRSSRAIPWPFALYSVVMVPYSSTVSFTTSGTSNGRGGIGPVSAITAPRQSVLPAVLNLTSAPLILVTIILVCVVVFLRDWLSDKSIGRCRRSSRTEKIASTDGEAELGLDYQTYNPSRSNPGRPTLNVPARDTRVVNYHGPDNPEVLSSPLTTMARSPTTPSVLRPKSRTPTPHAGPSPTISLPQGRYTGVLLPPAAASSSSSSSSSSSGLPRAVEAWRGIPYAQSTGGRNRFRPPVPLAEDEDGAQAQVIQQAVRFGQICPGSAARIVGAEEGEDCLNLNVYRPAGVVSSSSEKLLPVIVYVHGGAFNGGMGVERDMASFVGWAATPVLGVNFNYRVGALGFPSSAVADAEGCLNLGLRDQRLLFDWVRSNVGAFGGDRDRITVMGMSAGAHSVSGLCSRVHIQDMLHSILALAVGTECQSQL